jgi:signal transduction histidine kinase
VAVTALALTRPLGGTGAGVWARATARMGFDFAEAPSGLVVSPVPHMESASETTPPNQRVRLPWSARIAQVDERTVVPIALVLLGATGVGDYLTGVDVAFTLFYLAPLALGTWFRGRRFGLLLSAGAVLAGSLGLVASGDHHVTLLTVLWNDAGAGGVFVTFVVLLDRLHAFLDEERRKHGLAIAQLRHAERLNVIGTLAAGVAHELGTPLSVIAGNAEILDAEGLAPDKRHRASATIVAQVRRMTDIISHLLDFGRRGGGARQVRDLRLLVAKAAKLLEPIALQSQCTIACGDCAEDAKALVNASEIEQVLANLLLNAIQATPSGGTVRVSCEVERSSRTRHGAASYACLVVEDEGSGIRPEDLPQIFDPFFTTKGVGKGTGLGLSVSYGIVEDHGGTIHVKSELGRGSRFVVRLPLV